MDENDKYYQESFNTAVANVNSTWRTVQNTEQFENKEQEFVKLSKSAFDKSIENLEGNILAGRCNGVISALQKIEP